LYKENDMSDYLRSIIRTVLPAAWAAVVLYLARLGLPDVAVAWLSSNQVVEHVTELGAVAAVYGFVRYIEPHLPDWLIRILLGSAKAPTYAG
jgi:hypothetical protein